MERLQALAGAAGRLDISSESPGQTIEFGRLIGTCVPAGTVISLEGGLGAGKTLLAKGICAGIGIGEEVTSPSFILVEEYLGELPVLHFDLYRLDEIGEVENIGLFDAIDGYNIVVVEWGDRLPRGLFTPDVRVMMSVAGEKRRSIRIEAASELIERLEGEAK